MRIVNLCTHPIDVLLANGEHRRLAPSGLVVRVSCRRERREPFAGVVVHAIGPDVVEGLPACESGVLHVASTRVARAAAALGRDDVVAPDTAPESVIRDIDGHIVAVRGLQMFDAVRSP